MATTIAAVQRRLDGLAHEFECSRRKAAPRSHALAGGRRPRRAVHPGWWLLLLAYVVLFGLRQWL